jgi:hypothetical protein
METTNVQNRQHPGAARTSARRASAPSAWRAIETCPFELLYVGHDSRARVFLADGQHVALAAVTRRFGRGLRLDRPSWWNLWRFVDLTLAHRGRPDHEISFVPTLWRPCSVDRTDRRPSLPLPGSPSASLPAP